MSEKFSAESGSVSGGEGQNQEQEKSELTFRDLRVEDCEEMLKIRNSVVVELRDQGVNYGSGKEMTIEEWKPKFQERLYGALSGESMFIVAEDNGRFSGWIEGRKSPTAIDMPTAEVGDFVILKKSRSYENFRDLGRTWIERAQKEWGAKRFLAWTSTKNRARNLYKRQGFKEIEIIPSEEHEDYVKLEMVLE